MDNRDNRVGPAHAQTLLLGIIIRTLQTVIPATVLLENTRLELLVMRNGLLHHPAMTDAERAAVEFHVQRLLQAVGLWDDSLEEGRTA